VPLIINNDYESSPSIIYVTVDEDDKKDGDDELNVVVDVASKLHKQGIIVDLYKDITY
jgi:hypothetical protein